MDKAEKKDKKKLITQEDVMKCLILPMINHYMA